MIEIKEIGSYFNIDNNGYLINPSSIEKIQTEWKPLVDVIVESYKLIYGDNLVSIYIRGSVAKGEAVKNISDVDSFAYVNLEKDQIDWDVLDTEAEKLAVRFPFTQGIEYVAKPIVNAEKDQFWINQAILMYGKDLLTDKFKIGKEIMFHSKYPEKMRERIERNLGDNGSEKNIKDGCTWLCKQILRSGIELCYERSNKYSRDLYRCWETFSEYYPKESDNMKKVLHLALNPVSDKKILFDLADKWSEWFIQEKNKLNY